MPVNSGLRPQRRNMTQAEIDALWSQSSEGLRPTIAPVSALDFAVEAGAQLLDEADLSSLPLIGGVLAAATKGKAKPKGGVRAKDILAEAANKKSGFPSFAAWRDANPGAGQDLLDMSNLQPAIPGRPAMAVYTPKNGPTERVVDAMSNPDVREKLKQYVLRGMKEMPEAWYRTSPLFERFVEVYGDRQVAEQHFVNLMQHIAATSPGMSVPNNIRTGSYYRYLDANNLPVPHEYVTKTNAAGKEVTTLKGKPAPGYGAKTQGLHVANELDLRSGKGIDPIDRPKNPRFANNLIGNEMDVTIDTHNMRAIGMASKDPRFLASRVEDVVKVNGKEVKKIVKPAEMYAQGKITIDEALDHPTWWDSVPRQREYGYLQEQQQGLAKEMSKVAKKKLGRELSPAEWQDKMWVGAGAETGLDSPPEPILRTILARVAYTAARMKMDPQQTLNRFVRGEIPLLQVPLAAAGAGAALQHGEQSPDEQQPRF